MNEIEISKEDFNYTFAKWISGIPEPKFRFWGAILSKPHGLRTKNPEYTKITDAKIYAFDKSLELTVSTKKNSLLKLLSNLELSEKIDYTNAEVDRAKSIYSKFTIQEIIQKFSPDKLGNISAKKYLDVKREVEGLESEIYLEVSGVELNDFHTAIINYQYSRFCNLLLSEEFNEEKSEKLENLQHKLCILDDLGILDLIDEKFSDKYYKGTARHNDTAKLIASLLGIEDPEKVRSTLGKKDYRSKKQKANAVKTLNKHGLEPFKLID